MCEPVSAGIAAGAIVGGTAYNIYSARQQGEMAEEAAERNAAIGKIAAADALQRGAVEAGRARSATMRNIARGRAAMIAQGIDTQGAGLADLIEGLAQTGESEAQQIENNAARAAWGYENQAETAAYEGEVASYRAGQEATGSLLTGVGQLASLGASYYGRRTATDGMEPVLLGGG